ncbi:MAG: hypothetical protein WC375_08025 [Methanomassiliicoccales archaeon]|jgi:uncharacterized membrane protein
MNPKRMMVLASFLLIIAVILIVTALYISMPVDASSGEIVRTNLIGYESVCPFAPISTLLLALPGAAMLYGVYRMVHNGHGVPGK